MTVGNFSVMLIIFSCFVLKVSAFHVFVESLISFYFFHIVEVLFINFLCVDD